MIQERNTIQKTIIKNAILKSKDHPDADEVYEKIKKSYPSISKATVYRNLNSMASSNELVRVKVPGSSDRYDMITKKHYHLHCKVCDKIFDSKLEYIPSLNLTDEDGFEIGDHEITFEGICSNCRKK